MVYSAKQQYAARLLKCENLKVGGERSIYAKF